MVLAVVQHHKEANVVLYGRDVCELAAGERRAAAARSRCPGGNGRRSDEASSQASRQSMEAERWQGERPRPVSACSSATWAIA